MTALLGHLDLDRPASGRAAEFRVAHGTLLAREPDGRWRRYVPFGPWRQQLGQQVGLSDRARAGNRRRWQRFRLANKEHLRQYRRDWAERNREREREYARRKDAARKTDPARWAVYLARRERHRATKNERAREKHAARKAAQPKIATPNL